MILDLLIGVAIVLLSPLFKRILQYSLVGGRVHYSCTKPTTQVKMIEKHRKIEVFDGCDLRER